MSEKAHAGNLVIPEDKAGALYAVMEESQRTLAAIDTTQKELVAETRDAIKRQDTERLKEIAELREVIAKQQADLTATVARCDILDKNQARGQKLYTEAAIPGLVGGVSAAQRGMLVKVGEAFHDAFNMSRGIDGKFGHITRDQTVGTTTKGGYGVPRPIAEMVSALTPQFGFADKYCNRFEMPGGSLDINTSSGFPTVSHPGEATAPSDTGVTFGRLRMTAEKFISTNLHSREFLADAMTGVLEFVARRHIQAHALERDRQVMTASADPFTGVCIADNVGEYVLGTGSVSFHQFSHDSIMRLIDAADESLFTDDGSDFSNLRFLFHPQFLHNARRLIDTTGQPILAPLSVGHPLSLVGYDWSRSIKMLKQTGATNSKVFCAFGDWSYVWIGDTMDLEVAFSEEVKFGEAQVMMRVMQRYAVGLPVPAAFSRLKTSAS